MARTMMTPPEAAVVFSESEQQQFERDLLVADRVLVAAASKFGCRIQRNAGKGWPGRELSRRTGLKTFVLRLQLNPSYLENGEIYYLIVTQWSLRFGEILTRVLRHKTEGRYRGGQMDDEGLLRGELLRILGENLRPVM